MESVPPKIIYSSQNEEFFFYKESVWILEIDRTEDKTVSVARARVPVGKQTEWHRLKDTTERYLMVSGKGLVEVGDEPPTELKPQDFVIIPPNCRQRIANSGSDDLIFYVICSPPFQYENYEACQ